MMPFCNHTDEATNIVVQMYAQRQRNFIAAISTTTSDANGPLCLRSSDTAQVTEPDTILAGATAKPPIAAEFLLRLCATSIRDESYAGCINERFGRNSVDGDDARARCLYWADVLGYLLRQLPRALRLAAIIGAIKRLLG
jgi:hypothetical protein